MPLFSPTSMIPPYSAVGDWQRCYDVDRFFIVLILNSHMQVFHPGYLIGAGYPPLAKGKRYPVP